MTRELVDGLRKRLEELRLLEKKNKERFEVLEKRATPMKPMLARWDYICSNCGNFINNGSKWQCEHFCDNCGQAIDWSDEK